MKYAQIIKNTSKNNNNISDETLTQINKFSRRPLSKNEVYVFDMILCDNEIDRDFERFSHSSLATLKNLFLGKTGVFDHNPKGTNQTARIFSCDAITDNSKLNSLGQPYEYLLAKAYMVACEKNKDLILEIDAGIKKEISIGCSVKSKICSICNHDNQISRCSHIPGKSYRVNNEDSVCFFSLENPTDAYEWSFVAVPAQVNAGIIKNFKPQNLPASCQFLSETSATEITKSLKSLSLAGSDCFISASSLKSLVNLISSLEEESKICKDFTEDLRNHVSKMLTISQPLLTPSSIKTIVNSLSYKELSDFKTNLSAILESPISSPQLNSIDNSSGPESLVDNTMFTL